MVLSIVLLSLCLVFTIAGTFRRLLDRLKFSFPMALFVEITLLVGVIMPHIKTEYSPIFALFSFVFLLCGLFACICFKLKDENFYNIIISSFFSCVAEIVFLIIFQDYLSNEFFKVIIAILLGGVVFAFSYDHVAAFFSCYVAMAICFFVVAFSNLFYMAGSSINEVISLVLEVYIYATIFSLFLMNAFKRRRDIPIERRNLFY